MRIRLYCVRGREKKSENQPLTIRFNNNYARRNGSTRRLKTRTRMIFDRRINGLTIGPDLGQIARRTYVFCDCDDAESQDFCRERNVKRRENRRWPTRYRDIERDNEREKP